MNKTLPTDESVSQYISSIENDLRRGDATSLLQIMKDVTGATPVLWGSSIIGFGTHHYIYESGREGDIMKIGFAVRKRALVLYGLVFYDLYKENNKLLDKLGTHEKSKGCLYIKSLADVDLGILIQMIKNSFNNK